METQNPSCSAIQLEPVERKWILPQLVENTDPSLDNKKTRGRMKLDPTLLLSNDNNNISGMKPASV